MSDHRVTGAEALVKFMEGQGVEYIFGYPGGANIPILDALLDSPINFILTRHEQGATHMADGYARSSGKVGVVLVTSGPGATNAITGIMTAHMDSVPLVVLCGQTITANLGLDAFQEADVSGITYPVVKHSYLIKCADSIPRIMKEAFHLAQTGRPGPVIIDVPKDISSTLFTPNYDVRMQLPGYTIAGEGCQKQVQRLADLISKAKRPLLLVGHGAVIADAGPELKRLVELTGIPVTNTLLGKGAFPESDPLNLGMLGMHGTGYANYAVMNCDLIISVGSRWDDRILGKVDEFCAGAKRAHIDIDASEFNKLINTDVCIHGDARAVLEQLNRILEPGDTTAWRKQVADWKQQYPLGYRNGPELKAQHVIKRMSDLTGENAIIATDVGQHQMWAAQFCRTNGRFNWLTSGGAGTMGFGFPAALGAQFANPNRTVVAVVGDGGFQMTMCELATAVIHKLPVKVLILNNSYLGMVRQWQELFFDNRLSGVDLVGNPDFVKLAEAFGAKGLRISRTEEVDEILQQALDYNDGPCVIEAVVEKEENVFPMIPPSAPYGKMLLERPDTVLDKPVGST